MIKQVTEANEYYYKSLQGTTRRLWTATVQHPELLRHMAA